MSIPDTPLSLFLPYIIPHVPACPDPVAEFLLRQAAIEFCEETWCWRHTRSVAITTAKSTLVAPEWSEIDAIESATLDGVSLEPAVYIDTRPDELYGAQESNTPRWITQINAGHVIVAPFREGTLRLSMLLKPQSGIAMGNDPMDPLKDDKNIVPRFLFDHHAETLAAGALARIMILPDEPFTNPEKAAIFAGQFAAARDKAKTRFQKGQQRAPLRTKARWI